MVHDHPGGPSFGSILAAIPGICENVVEEERNTELFNVNMELNEEMIRISSLCRNAIDRSINRGPANDLPLSFVLWNAVWP